MASLKDIRTRIRTVKNTQQITRAMGMVAAARLRQAQRRYSDAGHYARSHEAALDAVAQRVDLLSHPLVAPRTALRHELVVFSSDRGLCGGFNANIFREIKRWLRENGIDERDIEFTVVGRKGNEAALRFLRDRSEPRHGAEEDERRALSLGPRAYLKDLLQRPSFDEVEALARDLKRRYLEGEVDAVTVFANRSDGVGTPTVAPMRLLPLAPREGQAPRWQTDFLYEPNHRELIEALLERTLAIQLWRALLGSMAGEQSARMAAMEAATQNAGEMISDLTLLYNRSRQAAITKELVEIVSGAEALHG